MLKSYIKGFLIALTVAPRLALPWTLGCFSQDAVVTFGPVSGRSHHLQGRAEGEFVAVLFHVSWRVSRGRGRVK